MNYESKRPIKTKKHTENAPTYFRMKKSLRHELYFLPKCITKL